MCVCVCVFKMSTYRGTLKQDNEKTHSGPRNFVHFVQVMLSPYRNTQTLCFGTLRILRTNHIIENSPANLYRKASNSIFEPYYRKYLINLFRNASKGVLESYYRNHLISLFRYDSSKSRPNLL